VAKKAPAEQAPAVPARPARGRRARPEPEPEPQGPGKNRPTPSRRDAEQARRKPLVPDDRRAAQKASRAQVAAERERARLGMAAGEERYLPRADRGPQRRLARDLLDRRFTVGELLIPIFAVFLVITFVVPGLYQSVLLISLYGFIVLAVLDGLLAARSIRKRLEQRFGAGSVERGLNWYVIKRALQLRVLRTPRPQVKRWQKVL
jgi:hypothetical protein